MTTPLPPQDSPGPDEKLPGDAGLAALYRQLPQNEPGPALDAAVLRAAAQALDGVQPALLNERRRSPRKHGDWVHPKADAATRQAETGTSKNAGPRRLFALGSAASLLLAAGLAWHLHEQPASTVAPMSTESVAPAQAAPIASPPAPAAPAPLAAPMPPKQPPPRAIAPSPPPAPPPMMVARNAVVAQQAAHASRESELVDTQRFATAKMMAPVAAAMPAPPSYSAPATNTAVPVLAETAPAAPMLDVLGGASAAAPADEATAAHASDTPTQELDKIRQLFAQGHDAEARQRLASFQHVHPQAELPPELREKLHQP